MSSNLTSSQNQTITLEHFVQNTLLGDTISEDPSSLIRINVQLQEIGYLLPGEEVKKIIVKVKVSLGASENANCILFITNFKILILNGSTKEIILHSIPMGTIFRIKEKKKAKSVLEVYCKDGRYLLLLFNSPKERPAVVNVITKYAFPSNCHQLFAFVHKMFISNDNVNMTKLETPIYFDTERDYVRQGVYNQKNLRYSLANSDFSLCPTYPKLLIVLSSVTDQELKDIGLFRSKGRIPSIVWFHPKKKSLLVRCSQPCIGINRARSPVDEKYLSDLKMPGQEKLYIVDSRPKANAVANMLRGGGFESPKVYKDIEIEFSDIENIHVIRNSLNGVFKACQNANVNQLAQLETDVNNSKWFFHIRLILASVLRVVTLLHHHGFTVLVHCSDGWDRTSQTTATCELLMDPYYRRIEGFIVLIEREWLQFGHQFALRYGHGEHMGNYKESQRSPIFPQWIDLVWQLLIIYPKFFEFNEKLLFYILEELYSCRYGTFLFNSVKERMENSVYSNTISCWEYVLNNKDFFRNPNYVEEKGVLFPNLSAVRLRLWSSLYFQSQDDRLKQAVIYENVDQISEFQAEIVSNPSNEDVILDTTKDISTVKLTKSSVTLRNTERKLLHQRRKSGSFILDKGQSILPQKEDGSFIPQNEEALDQRLGALFNASGKPVDNNRSRASALCGPAMKLKRSTSISQLTTDENLFTNGKSDLELMKEIIAEHNNLENNNNNNNNDDTQRPIITSNITKSDNTDRLVKTNSTVFKEMLSDDTMSKKDKRKARMVTPSIINNLHQEASPQRTNRAHTYEAERLSVGEEEIRKRFNSQSPANDNTKKRYVHASDITDYSNPHSMSSE